MPNSWRVVRSSQARTSSLWITSYAMQRRPHVVSTHSATQLRVCLFFAERVRDRPDINSTVMSNLFAFGIGRLGGRLSGAGVSTDA